MKEKYLVGDIIRFKNDLPYQVMAASDKYLVCVRKLNKRIDSALLKNKVEMAAYSSFQEAYKDLKDCPIYTLVDFSKNIRGKENTLFPMLDYWKRSDCQVVLSQLEGGELKVSSRNYVILEIEG